MRMTLDDLVNFLYKTPGEIDCWTEVSREGYAEPCGKVATAIARDEEDNVWPVCSYHDHRQNAVPLTRIVDEVFQNAD